MEKTLEELIEDVPDSDVLALEETHLPFLFRALHSLASDWNGVAVMLNVKERGQIHRNSTSVDDALALMLQVWLKSGKASWKKLLKAIAAPTAANNKRLAKDIANSYDDICKFTPKGHASSVSSLDIAKVSDDPEADIKTFMGNGVSARWYQMGIVMGVPVADLEIIRVNRDLSVVDREGAMIATWLQGGLLSSTWQVLVDAVEHEAGGGNPRLAKHIAAEVAKSVKPDTVEAVDGGEFIKKTEERLAKLRDGSNPEPPRKVKVVEPQDQATS